MPELLLVLGVPLVTKPSVLILQSTTGSAGGGGGGSDDNRSPQFSVLIPIPIPILVSTPGGSTYGPQIQRQAQFQGSVLTYTILPSGSPNRTYLHVPVTVVNPQSISENTSPPLPVYTSP